jgi:CheY-like chemotaxis protein
LLAEDSYMLRRLVGHVLHEQCARLVIAEDGREAVDIVLAAHAAGACFDLILMDVMLPRLNGCDATFELRQGGYRGRIVILTAADDEYDLARSLSAGADDFLPKPFTPPQLLEMVHRHLAA